MFAHGLLVGLPCHVEERRRASARPRQESKDKSPTVMLEIPHQLVLVWVRLEHHHLQCTIYVLHESTRLMLEEKLAVCSLVW